jgi:hypothetical protein
MGILGDGQRQPIGRAQGLGSAVQGGFLFEVGQKYRREMRGEHER